MTDDGLIYSDDKITVTRVAVTVKDDLYPLDEITKIEIYKPDTSKQDNLFCVATAAAFFCWFVIDSNLLFVLFFILGVSAAVFGQRLPYMLGLSSRTSDREHLLLELRDRAYLERVMLVIEQARRARSQSLQ
jgi:hypothetical protein